MFKTLPYRIAITLLALVIGLLNYPSEISNFAFIVSFMGLFFIMESIVPNLKRKVSLIGIFSIFFVIVCAITYLNAWLC